MAVYLKRFLILVLTWVLRFGDMVPTCPGVVECSDYVSTCGGCTYNITVKDVSRTILVTACLGSSGNDTSLKSYSNRTLKEISLSRAGECNVDHFDFNLSYLDSIAINFQNNSIRTIILKIRSDNLKTINLSYNRLQFVDTEMFNEYTNVVKLMLNKNEIKNIIEGSFKNMIKLESLDLSENMLTVLPDVFSPLKSLQHLNLSRNNIEFINEKYFNNWLLQHLDVSHNNLKKVAPGVLQLLPNLARLLLTDNPHLGISQLDTQLLVGAGRRLQQIDASRTGLYQVPEAFTHSVRFLSLVGNKISAIRCGDLDSYPLLQSLDFSDNKIISIEDDSLGRLEMLLFLNLNKNLLTVVPKTLPDELKYLSIGNNLIKNLTKNDFRNMPNLRILLLQSNQIRYIQNNVFDDLLSLEMLDLSNNPIQTLTPSTFDGPLSLKDLRLCFINVSVIETDGNFPVSSPESIQMLHLQSSPSLARQLLADVAALAALSHLQYLDLRMNNLSEIPKNLLFHLSQLKTLRLHGNSINCSAELWLREWMTWNKSLSNETCYYSTSENRDEDAKYNCTFSETFTINESLPPVNLYSTEMINKLLKYYGYLSNKTSTNKRNENKIKLNTDNNNNSISHVNDNSIPNVTTYFSKYKNNIRSTNTLQELQLTKLDVTNILDQNVLPNHNVFETGASQLETNNNEVKNPYFENAEVNKVWVVKKNKTGKRLNTPVNVTRVYHSDNRSRNGNKLNMTINEQPNSTETYPINLMVNTEFSGYHAASSSYAQYIGTVLVSVLIVASLILWASVRLRYRRRRSPERVIEPEDQIEVSNISGGVLW